MLTFNIITLFPNIFTEPLKTLPFKRALERHLIDVKLHQLRDFAKDTRGTVDDKPYGGGTGMILQIEPIYKALKKIHKQDPRKIVDTAKQRIVVLAPSGERYTQKKAENLVLQDNITIICGRYEGIDARVAENFATDVISIGDYVLSGGELPALVVMESIVRLIPGILEKEDAIKNESFSVSTLAENTKRLLEHPQYTRPEDFLGMKVPEILLTGHHKNIQDWKKKKQAEPQSNPLGTSIIGT